MKFGISFFVCALLPLFPLLANAEPVTYVYEFNNQGNYPYSSFAGLGGSSGNYDIIGRFSLTIDREAGVASFLKVRAKLQGVPENFDLNGRDFLASTWHSLESLDGRVDGNQITFDRCSIGSFGSNDLACEDVPIDPLFGKRFEISPSVFVSAPDKYPPQARKTRLVVDLDGDNLRMYGGSNYLGFVADGGSDSIRGASAILNSAVPEPKSLAFVVVACLFLPRGSRATRRWA